MRLVLIIAALTALVTAKPNLYKEKEDFQYSRSSSDDGSKSGFYGAQRGNMGGNYERAHNMDTLAQKQMSGLVSQVDQELGEGSKTRTGSVYTAGNSQGIYGSGSYDLRNLKGRNFQEGTSYDDSQSQSAYNTRSSAYSNGAYRASASNLQSNQEYYGGQAAAGYQQSNGYEQSSGYRKAYSQNSNGYQSQNGVAAIVPVDVVGAPGGRVAVPLTSGQYYNANQLSSLQSENSIKNDAEVLDNSGKTYTIYGKPKSYHTSYSYRKEWEKKSTKPVTLSSNPYPANSELYEDVQSQINGGQYDASRTNSQYSGSSGYNTRSSSNNYKYENNYNAQERQSNSNYNGGAYNAGENAGYNAEANTDLNSYGIAGKPKSYQSSYSYKKSWEHRGDPYVIIPATDDAAAQRYTISNGNDQDYQHAYKAGDCQINCHSRVARSYDLDQYFENQDEDGQQAQQVEDLVQSAQWDRSSDLTQQSQNKWDRLEDFGQETQQLEGVLGNLEDFGQQTQQLHGNLDKLENFGQQTQDFNQFNSQQQTQRKWN